MSIITVQYTFYFLYTSLSFPHSISSVFQVRISFHYARRGPQGPATQIRTCFMTICRHWRCRVCWHRAVREGHSQHTSTPWHRAGCAYQNGVSGRVCRLMRNCGLKRGASEWLNMHCASSPLYILYFFVLRISARNCADISSTSVRTLQLLCPRVLSVPHCLCTFRCFIFALSGNVSQNHIKYNICS